MTQIHDWPPEGGSVCRPGTYAKHSWGCCSSNITGSSGSHGVLVLVITGGAACSGTAATARARAASARTAAKKAQAQAAAGITGAGNGVAAAAATAAAADDLVFGDTMTVVVDAATPVLSVVRLFPGATLRATLAAAVCGYSSGGYGCGLAWCHQVLMHPCAAPCAAPLCNLVL
jgi:hypothetical protein